MNTLRERPLRVLAADDSAVMRSILWKLFLRHSEDRSSELPRMELCGIACDGVECLELVEQFNPDVLVLDLEMPKMNGLGVLDRLRIDRPQLPVIMCSGHTEHGARSTLEALGRGALDYVMKVSAQSDFSSAMQSLSQQLLPRIVSLAKSARVKVGNADIGGSLGNFQKTRSWEIPSKSCSLIEVVVIGLSTGGPTALEQLLPKLPKDFPVPVLIVQHMPKLFTGALAQRLNQCCALRVEQAFDNATIRPGTIWLAPGDAHMEVAPRRAMNDEDRNSEVCSSRIRLHNQEPLNHCRPSVDYLFLSAARIYGAGTLALVLTGMGSDGLDGAYAVHDAGGVVLAQDEATSAVWGMPGRVSQSGIANATLPLWGIADALKRRVGAGRLVLAESVVCAPPADDVRREMTNGLL